MGGTAKAVKGAAASLHTTNLAVGGASSEWMLHRLASFIHAEDEVDLVILEYDINDAALVADNPEDHEYFMTWTELLLRRLLLLPNRVAVLYFHTAVSHRSGGELMPLCSEYSMVGLGVVGVLNPLHIYYNVY
jgi:lysophospholipase L1-like esterase